jgi:hypothetical protein
MNLKYFYPITSADMKWQESCIKKTIYKLTKKIKNISIQLINILTIFKIELIKLSKNKFYLVL